MKADTKNKYIECIDKQVQVFVWLFMDDEAKLQDIISVKQAGMNHPNQIQTMENDTPFKYDKFQIIYLYIYHVHFKARAIITCLHKTKKSNNTQQ